jgi:glycosyltransferase involved in cell wall biosynthesis
LAVIEAGACGVPVLASAVGGHVELITDQQNGTLFAKGDVTQCAEKLLHMLMNNDATHQMAESFRSEIQVKYTWQVCARAYLQKMG